MILNVRDRFVGSNGGALEQALRVDAHRKLADLRIVSSVRQSDGVDLKFSLAGSASELLEIVAVLTDDVDRSNVLRAENTGRSLQHVSVVNGETERSVHLSLPPGFHRRDASGHRLVLFAQEPHQGAIVGAAVMPI